MDTAAAAALVSGSVPSNSTSGEHDSDRIRNIVLFFVDQQRQDCLGCYGKCLVSSFFYAYCAAWAY